jgi:hypothetical protein
MHGFWADIDVVVQWFTGGMMYDAECSWMIRDGLMEYIVVSLSVCVHSQEMAGFGMVTCVGYSLYRLLGGQSFLVFRVLAARPAWMSLPLGQYSGCYNYDRIDVDEHRGENVK